MSKYEHLIRRIWLIALLYLILLFVLFATVLNGMDLPDWIEWVFKGTIFLAFIAILGLPLLYLISRVRPKKPSLALKVAGYAMLAGYVWFFAELVYIKLKTCNVNDANWDTSWHCHVEGTQIVASFVLIPFFAAICGVIAGGIGWLLARMKKGRK